MKRAMVLTAAAILLLVPLLARADTESPELAKYRARVDVAVKRALVFLAARLGGTSDDAFANEVRHTNAVPGLAGMAFLSVGHTPGRGPYGDVVNRCIDFILATPAQGPSDRKLKKRVKKIQKTFARYGALNDDMDAFTSSTNKTMLAKALNDVGWKIAAGNYQRFLYQLDANETSQGYWRQGSKDQPYGRYARGFDLKAGKTAMYFDLDDNFYVPRDKDRKQTVELRVVYLDKGASRWELNYFCGIGQKKRTGLRFSCKNSGEWKEVSRKVTTAIFNNKLSRNSDLMLEHVRGEDNTLFHMVEIKR